eukprot:m.352362 g.352362  ORF g.352362 m.352362 type:complete len:124 (+) comp16498_c0_seq1:578-949(+)
MSSVSKKLGLTPSQEDLYWRQRCEQDARIEATMGRKETPPLCRDFRTHKHGTFRVMPIAPQLSQTPRSVSSEDFSLSSSNGSSASLAEQVSTTHTVMHNQQPQTEMLRKVPQWGPKPGKYAIS